MQMHRLFCRLLLLIGLMTFSSVTLSQPEEPVYAEEPSTQVKEEPSSIVSSPEQATPVIPAANFSGIYISENTDQPWYLSVHIKGNDIVVTDMSEHLDFLERINYISEEEAETGIQVSAEDRVFQGKFSQPFVGENYYRGYLDPILPLEQRASDHSKIFYGYVFMLDQNINGLEQEGSFRRAFFEISLFLKTVPLGEGMTYGISLNRDAGGIYFMYADYVKLF